jgi:type I restriction enzyme S subunit
LDKKHLRLTDRGAFNRLTPELDLRKGDILWNSTGTGTIGRAIEFDGSIDPITVDSHVTIVRVAHALPPYIARFIHTIRVQHLVTEGNVGSTNQLELPRSFVEELEIPLPPLPEQRRIVERIDALLAEIAEGEAALKEARKGLALFRRSLLKAAVTGELTRDWPGTNMGGESGAGLLQRIKNQRSSRGTTQARGRRLSAEFSAPDAALPKLPDGWVWGRLGEFLQHLTSGSRDWVEYYDRGASVFVMAQNVRPGKFNRSYVKNVDPPLHLADVERSRICKDDILLTIVGANTGDACRVDFEPNNYFICQSVALLRPTFKGISRYLEMYLIAPDGGREQMNKYIYGAGRPHLSFDQIESIAVPLPPASEIDEILRRVSDAIAAADDAEKELDDEAADAARLKQSILKAAFEGRLVPQDPNDEPASALLATLAAPECAAANRRPRSSVRRAERIENR